MVSAKVEPENKTTDKDPMPENRRLTRTKAKIDEEKPIETEVTENRRLTRTKAKVLLIP